MDVVLKLPKAHAKQQPIIDSKAKVKILKCGRQSGKSVCALIIAVKTMLAGKIVGYIAHEFDLSKKFYNQLLKTIPKELISKSNATSLSIELVTGGMIQFYSGNATKTLRGNTIHLCICDEFAFWRNPEESYNEDISATLARHNGDLIVLSTPYGKNFFSQLYETARQCTDGTMQAFYFTCLDNPYLSAEYLARKERELPSQTWKQEYLAIESANQNCIVDADVIERNTIKTYSTKPTQVIGIDVAKTYDWTSITFLDADGAMTNHVRFQKSHDDTMRYIRTLPKNILKVMDSSGSGDVMMEMMYDVPNLVGFKFNKATKPPLIKELIITLERDQLKFNEQTATELTNFQFKYNAGGYIEYEGKPHDDSVISLALANKYLKESYVPSFDERFYIGG